MTKVVKPVSARPVGFIHSESCGVGKEAVKVLLNMSPSSCVGAVRYQSIRGNLFCFISEGGCGD